MISCQIDAKWDGSAGKYLISAPDCQEAKFFDRTRKFESLDHQRTRAGVQLTGVSEACNADKIVIVECRRAARFHLCCGIHHNVSNFDLD